MTLKRQEKHRYILVLCSDNGRKCLDKLSKSIAELFGEILLQQASLKLVSEKEKYVIIRCSLYSFDSVLCAMVFSDPSILSLASSGSITRLKKTLSAYEKDLDWISGM